VQVNVRGNSASNYPGTVGNLWNNYTSRADFATVGYQVSNAVDKNGISTGINLAVLNGTTFSSDFTGFAQAGATIVPQEVMDSMFQSSAVGGFEIAGLDPALRYHVWATGSYNTGGSTRNTAFRLYNNRGDADNYDTSISMALKSNTSNWVKFEPGAGIRPNASNKIFLTVAEGSGGNKAHISAFIIIPI
jgi:hypothetical protein